MDNLVLIVLASAGIALLSAVYFFWNVVKRKVKNKELSEIAGLIQEGSYAFLKKEYTILSFFVVAMFAILWLVVDLNIFNADGFNGNSGPWTAISYLAGAIGSSIAGIAGMNIAVRGNSRTAEAAEGGLNQALRVAFNTGSVMGLTVVGVGLLGVTLLWVIFDQIAGTASATNIIAGFGLSLIHI